MRFTTPYVALDITESIIGTFLSTPISIQTFDRMALPQLLPSHSSSSSVLYKTNLKKLKGSLGLNPDRKSVVRRSKKKCLRCCASTSLPLFPLPLVLFPGAILPLQVFEYRYRIMMHTLLETDLRFGVIYSDAATGTAEVGCVGEVVKHERLVDDRFFLICKGQERFRVSRLLRTRPYLVAEVAWLEDRPSGEDDLDALSNEVEMYMKDVIRLSNRLNGKDPNQLQDLRKNLFPTPFSFFVASTFEGAPREQQALLQLEDTALRLKREKETLRNTLNYLSAASAVKDVFPSSSSSSS